MANSDEKSIDHWDAGHMGCGELVMILSARLKKMESGQVLSLIAHDEGAIEDIPAWCNMTGHLLIGAQHPQYFIQRRSEST